MMLAFLTIPILFFSQILFIVFYHLFSQQNPFIYRFQSAKFFNLFSTCSDITHLTIEVTNRKQLYINRQWHSSLPCLFNEHFLNSIRHSHCFASPYKSNQPLGWLPNLNAILRKSFLAHVTNIMTARACPLVSTQKARKRKTCITNKQR